MYPNRPSYLAQLWCIVGIDLCTWPQNQEEQTRQEDKQCLVCRPDEGKHLRLSLAPFSPCRTREALLCAKARHRWGRMLYPWVLTPRGAQFPLKDQLLFTNRQNLNVTRHIAFLVSQLTSHRHWRNWTLHWSLTGEQMRAVLRSCCEIHRLDFLD